MAACAAGLLAPLGTSRKAGSGGTSRLSLRTRLCALRGRDSPGPPMESRPGEAPETGLSSRSRWRPARPSATRGVGETWCRAWGLAAFPRKGRGASRMRTAIEAKLHKRAPLAGGGARGRTPGEAGSARTLFASLYSGGAALSSPRLRGLCGAPPCGSSTRRGS